MARQWLAIPVMNKFVRLLGLLTAGEAATK